MKRWALMQGDTVSLVIEQDALPQLPGQWCECGQAAIGWTYDGRSFKAPRAPSWADADLDPSYWWIDKGPFFDRFGGKALSIVASADQMVQGLVTLIMPRAYIDLRHQDLPGMLALLVDKGLITAAESVAILTTPTTEYERHVKGLPQPL